MANYQALAARYARKYGIPVSLFKTLVRFESGYQPQIVSSAGAIGLTQLMPATAKGLGVDPFNPAQNLDGGARYLKQQHDRFGSWDLALAAYNAGPGAVQKYGGIPPYAQTQHYVKGILGASGPFDTQLREAQPWRKHLKPNPAPKVEASAQPQAPQPPDLSSVALDNLSHIASGTFTPAGSLGALTSAVAAQPVSAPSPAPAASSPAAATPAPKVPPKPKQAWNWKKWVTLASGADRDGATTSPNVLRFVAKIGRLYGQPLTIGTGTNHNQYVVDSHRESQHWTGHAADIPSSGDELTRLGQEALIAAGMSRAKALKQTGGVYNVGRYQILFNTKVGGNHFNHLHVGVR